MNTKQERAFQRLQNWQGNEVLVGMAEAAYSRAQQPETADDLLRDPYFFRRLLADIAKAGLVGEKRNALATYIIATSRLREKPLNEIVKGASSGGKNHLVRTVLNFFPEDAVVAGSSISAHAVDYAGTNRLAHRIVYIDEQKGVNHPLRQLISEGRLVRWTTGMENGRWVMKEHVTKGPVACITTTTKNVLSIDDENRNISVWIDESYGQTQAIAKAQAATQREILMPERLRLWREVQDRIAKLRNLSIQLQPWFVDIVEKILPYGDLRIRRYWPAFIEVCKVVALIRAAKWLEFEQDQEITVTFEDFATALCIFDRVIGESLTRAGGDAEMAIGDLVERLSSGDSGVTAGDLVGQPGIRSLDQAYRALRRARDAGAIYIVNERERNNEKRYARSPEATFLGRPEVIVTKLGLKISGHYIHPGTGQAIAYGK